MTIMPTMTVDQLRDSTGSTLTKARLWHEPLSRAMGLFGIVTPVRAVMFLANVGHETGGLTWSEEIWGPTPAQKRYEGRRDLGNIRAGDGLRYKGRGPFQITGRDNYRRTTWRLREVLGASLVPDFEAEPHLLASPRWGSYAAGLYWRDRNLSALADVGDFESVCDSINLGRPTAKRGDSNGFADRLRLYDAACVAFGIDPA